MISLTREQAECVLKELRQLPYTCAIQDEAIDSIMAQLGMPAGMTYADKWIADGWSSPSDPEWSKGECYPPIKPANPS